MTFTQIALVIDGPPGGRRGDDVVRHPLGLQLGASEAGPLAANADCVSHVVRFHSQISVNVAAFHEVRLNPR